MSADLLVLARTAALAAGRVLLARRDSVLEVTTKSSATDPVTSADTAAQRAIVAVLGDARPQDGLIGEEALRRSGTSGVSWIIDPLDGTVNYLYGRDEWAVSVAARDGSGAVAGVVHAPALNRTYTAVRGQGAWLDERRLAVRGPADLSSALVGTGFSYTAEGRLGQASVLGRLLPRIADIRRGGSAALDLAAVASGTLDAFYEDDLEEWDWAAGALLASEAGAVVGALPGPGSRSGIYATDPALRDDLLDLLRPDSADH
ncbi:MAG: inositol monophosphatase family protein [Streptosporangiaceae bacterium]